MRIIYRTKTPIIGSLLEIPKDSVDVEALKADLTISNGAYFQAMRVGSSVAGMAASIELFEEGETTIKVPRHYNPPWNGEPPFLGIAWRCRSPSVDLKSSITLRNHTQALASKALVRDKSDKILALSCGKGKTVVGLHAAAMGNRAPFLVVVNTTALLDQWMERISEFYGIPKNEIGHVQAGTERWRGCKVVVGMLHSISMKRYPPEFYEYFRLVIFDEAHRLGAQEFSEAMKKFPCERWGLTATLRRADGNDKVIQMHLGEVCYQDLSQDLKPKVYFLNCATRVDEARFIWRGNLNLANLTTWLCENETRNNHILSWINRAAKRGRTVLVLGERLTQVHSLYEGCEIDSKAIHIGAQSQDERRAALRHQVVFATQHLAKEGLDRPEFDTLMILVPFTSESRMQQSVGRIQREVSGKQAPTVLVFEDNISIISAMARKMKRYFEAQGFEVRSGSAVAPTEE